MTPCTASLATTLSAPLGRGKIRLSWAFSCAFCLSLCWFSFPAVAHPNSRPSSQMVTLLRSGVASRVSVSQVPTNTPPCGPLLLPLCVMGTPPSVAAGLPPPRPLAPALLELDRYLKTHRLNQSGGVADTSRYVALFQAAHPEVWPVKSPSPGQRFSLCPSCVLPDGSMHAYMPPTLIGGVLRSRPSIFLPAPFRRPWQWYACVIGFVALLLAGGVYLATKHLQRRRALRHAAAVDMRRTLAAARAINQAAVRTGQSVPPPR